VSHSRAVPPPHAAAGVVSDPSKARLRILPPISGELQAACQKQRDQIRQQAASQQPATIEVPTDDELAGLDHPVDELRNLRARTAQRDVTCAGPLRSRYTTAEVLRALPAHAVLGSSHHADLIAQMITGTCGDNPTGWDALAAQSSPPSKSVTFGTWFDRLVDNT
jgi:hypothetical protein